MELIKYFETMNRLCESYNCCECPIGTDCCMTMIPSRIETNAKILEQWAKDHPIKTNLDVAAEGLVKLGYTVDKDFMRRFSCPPLVSKDYVPHYDRTCHQAASITCYECRKWWDAEWKGEK